MRAPDNNAAARNTTQSTHAVPHARSATRTDVVWIVVNLLLLIAAKHHHGTAAAAVRRSSSCGGRTAANAVPQRSTANSTL